METIFEDLLLFIMYKVNKLLNEGLSFLKGESTEFSLNLEEEIHQALHSDSHYKQKIEKY
jgi:hypothetical protein